MRDNDSAFPGSPGFSQNGMTLPQYAAIHLRVPMSGDPGLDAMIRESRRMDFMGQAVAGLLAGDNLKDETSEGYARRAYGAANALLAVWEDEARDVRK
jgi:hypothetical protein